MKTKSILKMSVLLVLSLVLGICINCKHGGSTQKALDGLVVVDPSGETYLYFFNNQIFYVRDYGGTFKKSLTGSYSGNTLHFGSNPSCTVTITSTSIICSDGRTMTIVSDPAIITKVKNAQWE